jgi:hypothetical protein
MWLQVADGADSNPTPLHTKPLKLLLHDILLFHAMLLKTKRHDAATS